MITPKQKQILDFIIKFRHDRSYSPSLAEIATEFKKSKATIHQYVNALRREGLLDFTKGETRSLRPKAAGSTKKEFFRRARIGIIGYGIVGQAVAYGFSNDEIHIYDKFKDSETLSHVAENSDYIFICLPTPIQADESGIDLSIVNGAVKELAGLISGTDKIIIIKSTVIPGTTRGFMDLYPKTLFCFNPEFLREKSFLQDFVSSDRIVIGADNDLVLRRVSSLYQRIMPQTPIFQTDPTTAEMVKYMANCFLATKVIFANEMYDICEKLGIKYDEVKQMVTADSRITNTHLDVTSVRGFGQKCFPKDLLALRALAKKKGVDTSILDTVWAKNLRIRKIRDWEEIPFAVSKASRASFGHKN